jgi:hypothetical protein
VRIVARDEAALPVVDDDGDVPAQNDPLTFSGNAERKTDEVRSVLDLLYPTYLGVFRERGLI